jgi:hypothetical protein
MVYSILYIQRTRCGFSLTIPGHFSGLSNDNGRPAFIYSPLSISSVVNTRRTEIFHRSPFSQCVATPQLNTFISSSQFLGGDEQSLAYINRHLSGNLHYYGLCIDDDDAEFVVNDIVQEALKTRAMSSEKHIALFCKSPPTRL